MKKQEKTMKFKTFYHTFTEAVENDQPALCHKFEGMLVKKLKPRMKSQWDLTRTAERTFTEFLVEMGYDKALGYAWENNSTFLDYYGTWFDEVWYCFEEHRWLLDDHSWGYVQEKIENCLI